MSAAIVSLSTRHMLAAARRALADHLARAPLGDRARLDRIAELDTRAAEQERLAATALERARERAQDRNADGLGPVVPVDGNAVAWEAMTCRDYAATLRLQADALRREGAYSETERALRERVAHYERAERANLVQS